MTKIYLIDVSSIERSDLNRCVDLINKYVDLKINYKKKQSVVAWFFLIRLLNKCLDKADIKFKQNVYGKPFLIEDKIFFNISHSSNMVVVAVSQKLVGVDVERIANHNLNIANRCFDKREQDYIFSVKDEQQIKKRFYVIWTLKESYLKFKGVGLSQKLDSFLVHISDGGKVEVISDLKKNSKMPLLCNSFFFEINDYVISCCCQDNCKFQIIKVEKSQLFDDIL